MASVPVNKTRKSVKSLYIVAIILIFGPLLGLNALLMVLLDVLLGNPADGTTARAAINIIVFVFWGLCIVTGFILAIIGIVRSIRNSGKR